MFFRYFWSATVLLCFEKRVTAFRAKNRGSHLYVDCATKNLEARYDLEVQPMCGYSTCRHRTCNDSWYSATKKIKYSFLFSFLLPLAAHGRSDSPPVVTATEVTVGVPLLVHELYPFYQISEPILCLWVPLPQNAPKNIGGCVGRQGLSIDATLDPSFTGWTMPLNTYILTCFSVLLFPDV